MTEREQTLLRMNRAFEKSINVYTEINLTTMKYRQINLNDFEHYIAPPEGDYITAFEAMCNEEIDPKDVPRVREFVSPEALKRVGEDPNGADDVRVRYHLLKKDDNNQMESHILFVREKNENYAISIVTDVTEQMELAHEKEILENILTNVTTGVYIGEIKDLELQVIAANPAMCELLGIENSEADGLLDSDVENYLSPKDDEVFRKFIKSLSTPGQIQTVEYQILNKKTNKPTWVSVTGKSVEGTGQRTLVYLSHTIINDLKEQQMMLEYHQRAVQQAEKQGNLSIWTYNIDTKKIVQQMPLDVNGHMGYPVEIANVPECFVESNSVHPDDIEIFRNCYRGLEEGSQNEEAIYRLRNQNTGKFGWVHMFYQRMEDDGRDERIAVGFSYDADAQQKAIEKYKAEQELRKKIYADAVNYIEYNLTMSTFEGRPQMYQEYDKDHWEKASFEEYKKNLRSRVDPEYIDKVADSLYAKKLLEEYKKGTGKISCEYRSMRTEDKPAIWLRATANMVQRPDNEDVMAFVYVENIDAQKKRQLALETSMEDGVESITLIHLSDGVARRIQTDAQWEHQNLERTFIYNEDFLARASAAVVPEEREFSVTAARISTIIEQLSQNDIYQYSLSITFKDGTFRRQLFRFRYLDDQKTDVVLSLSDITEVYLEDAKKTEQLKAAMEEAKAANSATTQFLSRMSHDMRTPMNGILGMAKLSEQEEDINVLRSNIQKMEESGEYLLGLINDTLDFQRIQSGRLVLEPTVVEASKVVENIVNMIQETAKQKRVELKVVNRVDLHWYIRVDSMRLKQVMINLLSNAVKFTPEGGIVELGLDLLSRDGNISHDMLSVKDTGCGMSQKFLENGIFQPFSQETNATTGLYAGSGLGLSIAKSLVELMGGRIEVESELGVGTTFRVYLDFERIDVDSVEEANKKIQSEEKTVEESLQGKQILLAEDNPLNAEIAKRLLEKVGCRVMWAKDGAECVERFEESKFNQFDAILMDIRMPNMTGLEATQAIRKLNRLDAAQIPIVAMTANAFDQDVKECLDAGMNAHVGKPIVVEQLYRTLVECIIPQ